MSFKQFYQRFQFVAARLLDRQQILAPEQALVIGLRPVAPLRSSQAFFSWR
jgi:hypothetical protein